MRTVDDVINRVRAEYMEMPGLRLTASQVQRLCGIEPKVCAVILDALVGSKFLSLTPDGYYARMTDGSVTRPRAAKAGIVDIRANRAS